MDYIYNHLLGETAQATYTIPLMSPKRPDFVNVLLNFPKYFQDFLEVIEYSDAWENELFEAYLDLTQIYNDRYINTATEEGVAKFERRFNITADPATESLEFRRMRVINRMSLSIPYTTITLRERLDMVIGAGKYDLVIDYENQRFTLYGEFPDNNWYKELYILINQMKPAHVQMLFNFQMTDEFSIKDAIYGGYINWNHRIQTTAKASDAIPLASFISDVLIKGEEVVAITQQGKNLAANTLSQHIGVARINNTYNATITKTVVNEVIQMTYLVPQSVGNITKIDIMSTSNEAIFSSNVGFPVTDTAQIQHNITVRD